MNNNLWRLVAVCCVLLSGLNTTHAADGENSPVTSVNNDADTPLAMGTDVPRWEFGLAAAALKVPAYPASASASERSFLVPWFVYRGDKVRLQDGGVQLIAVENPRVTVDVSIAGSLNASSADAPLRTGMPDLDYLLEFGPKVTVRLFDESFDNGHRRRLVWSTALRAAVSTDFKSVDSRGMVLGSQLRYRHTLNPSTSISASLGGTWTGGELMDYLYRVDEAFALPERPVFDARGGFLGASLNAGISHELNKRWSMYVGVSNAFYSGAANRNSPLFERDTTVGIFGGISWTIKQSDESIRVLGE